MIMCTSVHIQLRKHKKALHIQRKKMSYPSLLHS